ncbi:MAG: HAD family phosphatase [Planctomycetaceae bacterium]|jgi:HAD superfamily hydrolase (TIGR01509 family)|nr:HAD family phosphatase [Planctomycetaceae bacterium]
MTIKAVAFDMDGLMFDTEDVYWKSASALLARRGKIYTPELCAAVMGRPPQYCFELFKKTFGFSETWQELQHESENFFLQFLDDGFSTMPGLLQLLEHLEHYNIPKGICTSSVNQVVSEVLRRKNLATRFDFVLTAENITQGKPDPEIYLKAIDLFGVQPQEMLVLEDSVAGSQAADNAGAFPVVVLAEHNQGGDFRAARLIVNSLDAPEILQLLTPTPENHTAKT